MSQPDSRRLERAAQVAIVLVGLTVILLTFRDYGASWDESTNLRYGDLILRYLGSGFQDRSVDQFINMRYYGPLFDLLIAILSRLAPLARVEVHHLAISLTGLATLPALFRLGRLLESPLIGLMSAGALATMPVFYGHAFVNGKDIPFACAFAWSMVAIIDLFAGRSEDRTGSESSHPRRRHVLGRQPSWRLVIVCGLVLGAAAAVRPGGFLLLLPMLLTAGGLAVVAGRLEIRAIGDVGAAAAKLAAIVGLAWGGMVAFWPWAHLSPIVRPLQAMRVAAGFPAVYPVLFEGRWIHSNALPWRYLLEYLAITTPPATLLLAVAGLVMTLRWISVDPAGRRTYTASIVSLWLMAPLALWTLLRPNIVDGLRHFLFVLPALALMTGVGAAGSIDAMARALQALNARSKVHRGRRTEGTPPAGDAHGGRLRPSGPLGSTTVLIGSGVLIALLLVEPVLALVRLHPYQMTYFNAFIGGLAGVEGRYETDYWLTSYKEGMEWIQDHGPSRVPPLGGSTRAPETVRRVLVAANDLSRMCAEYYARPGTSVETTFEFSESPRIPPPFDYYLSTTRYDMDRNFPGSPIVHRIGRDGATFAVIRRGPVVP